MAFLSQATSSWRLASSSRLPFRSMLLTPRGGPWCLAPRAHQIPVYLMVFSTFLCRAFTAHGSIMIRDPLPIVVIDTPERDWRTHHVFREIPRQTLIPCGHIPLLDMGHKSFAIARVTRID